MTRTLVQGILNVTPDSFSDGGQWVDPRDAIAHGMQLIADGADLIDVGGESTRPGAQRTSQAEELQRVLPVVTELSKHVQVSVDTMRAEVARAAIDAGATIINDVSGGLSDPQMLGVVASNGVDFICQHWRGYGDVMNAAAKYHDVVGETAQELKNRVSACLAAGIESEKIIIDPGLGFAKVGDDDWQILANLETFTAMGYRVLIGASRKRFLAAVTGARPAQDRDGATAAVSTICALAQVWAVRTHEVRLQRDCVAVAEKLLKIRGANYE